MKIFHRLFVCLIISGGICNASAQQDAPAGKISFIPVSTYELPDGQGRFIEGSHGHLAIAITGKKGLIGLIKDQTVEPLVEGFIADAERGADGSIWYIDKKKIGSVGFSQKASDQDITSLFFKDNSLKELTISGNALFHRDRLGGIWLANAPFHAGAGMKSLKNPVLDGMSGVSPLPLTTDPFGNMWALIPVGAGMQAAGYVTTKEPNRWNILDKSKGFPVDNWNTIVSDFEGIIWVSGKAGLCYFDPRLIDKGWHRFPVKEQLRGGDVSVLTLSSTGNPLIALSNGEIFEVTINANDSALVWKINTDGLPVSVVNALYTDRAGRIWVVADNRLYRQDKQPSDWQSLTSMPYGNHDLSGVEFKGKIYTAGGGGLHGFPVATSSYDRLLIYDIRNDRWELSSPMSMNHRYCEVGLLDGKIWVIGGFNYNVPANIPRKGWSDILTNTVEIYDPGTGTWSLGPQLDVPRGETVACTMAGRLYVFGSTGKEIFSTLSIGPGETKWRTEPAAPVPIWQTDGCAVNDKAYIVIGRSKGMIMYDPATQTWHTDLPDIPGAKAPRSTIVGAYKGKVWIISGHSVDNVLQVYKYSPDERSWTFGPSFPYSASWSFAMEAEGKLYVPGGATNSRNRKGYVYWDLFRVLEE